MADLTGKITLITAAAQGIGRASVEAFARAGAKVIATDINADKLKELDGLANVTTRVLNVLSADEVNKAVAEIGRIDILFNCAGVVHSGNVLEMPDKDLEFAFAPAAVKRCAMQLRQPRRVALIRRFDHGRAAAPPFGEPFHRDAGGCAAPDSKSFDGLASGARR